MKSEKEVEEMHDMLHDATEGVIPKIIPDECLRSMKMCANLLCWIMEHDADTSHWDLMLEFHRMTPEEIKQKVKEALDKEIKEIERKINASKN